MNAPYRPAPVPGFRFGGVCAGIKASGALDLGVIVADRPVAAAAVFTQNQVVAAPVVLSRGHMAAGVGRAVVVNSGNANACTGSAGDAAAARTAATAADLLGCEASAIQVASTGVIGVPLPLDRLLDALGNAFADADRNQAGADRFGEAICTTDRFAKGASVRVGDAQISVFAKGAGMIAPNMATLLVYAISDASVASADLQALWPRVIAASFNAIVVDGDTSTNDTAVLFCGGSGAALQGADLAAFEAGLSTACQEAAVQVVADGEGARCVVEIRVRGGRDDGDARRVADAIVRSPLCKTAFHGADPNWGRLLAAAGRSGAIFDPRKSSLNLRCDDADIGLFDAGLPLPFEQADAVAIMKKNRFGFDLCLGTGPGSARVWTCDFGHNYITLNAEYTS
jgi:glutamate N-acetyltransferase/amino-acid N-acetyltransferase